MTKTVNAEIAIRVNGVGKFFGAEPNLVKALDDVSIDIQRNEFFTLLGPSGCGKTTLLRLIAGFESPTFGQILLDNKDITHLPPNHRSVTTVIQSYALFPHLTVAENISFGLEMLNKSKREIIQTVDEMLFLCIWKNLKIGELIRFLGGSNKGLLSTRIGS